MSRGKSEKPDELSNEDFDVWQQQTSQQIYTAIIKLYENMSYDLTQSEIAELIINALAMNLGSLLGQVSDDYRDKVVDIAKATLDTSCLTMVEQMSFSKYGNIGHG